MNQDDLANTPSQPNPLPITADEIRSRLQALAELEPGIAQAAQRLIQSTVPELMVEVFDYLTNTPPTTSLDQVGRSFMGGFLMQVKALEPMEPRLSLRKLNENSLELSARQTVYGRSFRNDRLVLFIAGGERTITIRVSESGEVKMNNQIIDDSPEWESELRQKVTQELSKT